MKDLIDTILASIWSIRDLTSNVVRILHVIIKIKIGTSYGQDS